MILRAKLGGSSTHPSFDASTPRFLTDFSPLLPGRLNNAAYDMGPDESALSLSQGQRSDRAR